MRVMSGNRQRSALLPCPVRREFATSHTEKENCFAWTARSRLEAILNDAAEL
jgi:hypothetical protein